MYALDLHYLHHYAHHCEYDCACTRKISGGPSSLKIGRLSQRSLYVGLRRRDDHQIGRTWFSQLCEGHIQPFRRIYCHHFNRRSGLLKVFNEQLEFHKRPNCLPLHPPPSYLQTGSQLDKLQAYPCQDSCHDQGCQYVLRPSPPLHVHLQPAWNGTVWLQSALLR